MATAHLGGFAPQVGLFAFVAATVGFIAFGANRVLSAGANSTIAPIFAGEPGGARGGRLAALRRARRGAGADGRAPWWRSPACVRLGWIADLLSRPVLTGFLAGIAVHIVLSQAPAALGLPDESGRRYQPARPSSPARSAGSTGPRRPSRSASSRVTFGAEKLSPRIPGALIGLAAATLATAALGLARQGVPVLGALPSGLPAPAMPRLHPESLVPLVGLAGVIALVVMVQTAAVTRSFSAGDARSRRRPRLPRRRRRRPARRPLRRVSGQRQPAPHGGGVGERAAAARSAAWRPRPRSCCWRRSAAGLLADTPTAALAGVLFFVAQRIFHAGDFMHLARRAPAEFALAVLTTAADRAAADPDRRGDRHLPVAGARRLHHHPGAADPASSGCPAPRSGGRRRRHGAARREAGRCMVVGFQAPLSFLNAYAFRRDVERAIARGARRGAAAGAGGQQHRRDRLHRRGDPQRGHPQGARRGRRLRDRPAGVGPRRGGAAALRRDGRAGSRPPLPAASTRRSGRWRRPQLQAPTTPDHSAIWAGGSARDAAGLAQRLADGGGDRPGLRSVRRAADRPRARSARRRAASGAARADRRRRRRRPASDSRRRGSAAGSRASPAHPRPPRRPAGRRRRPPRRGPAVWPARKSASPGRRTR